MDENANQGENRSVGDAVDEARPQVAKFRRRSQLPLILGIGGGAVAGVCVGAEFYDDFPAGVPIFLLVGAVIGGFLRHVGIFAGAGMIVGFVLVLLPNVGGKLREDGIEFRPRDRGFFVVPTSIVAGSLVGGIWTILRSRHRESQAEAIETTSDRRKAARACLLLGPLIGLLFGVLIGGPVLIGGIVFGALVGVAFFFAFTLPSSR
jgi:hypothetical protein